MTPLHENAGPSVVARPVIVEPSVASERKQPSDSEDVTGVQEEGCIIILHSLRSGRGRLLVSLHNK